MNIHRTIFSGQTYVQKWFLDYGHFHGRIWPLLTLMAIFTHKTAGIITIIWPKVAHGGEEESHEKIYCHIQTTDVVLKSVGRILGHNLVWPSFWGFSSLKTIIQNNLTVSPWVEWKTCEDDIDHHSYTSSRLLTGSAMHYFSFKIIMRGRSYQSLSVCSVFIPNIKERI